MVDSAKFWDARADGYAKKPVKDVESYERTLDRTREYLSEEDEVLEVACGTGTTALRLAPHVRGITASDISSRMVEIARAKGVEQRVENVRFEQATLFDETLSDESFDVVMAFNFLHLLEDIPGAVGRIHELLKPGGFFISKSVCLGEQSRLWGVLLVALRVLRIAPLVQCLTVTELEGTITRMGFEIIETGFYPPSPPSRFIVARKRD